MPLFTLNNTDLQDSDTTEDGSNQSKGFPLFTIGSTTSVSTEDSFVITRLEDTEIEEALDLAESTPEEEAGIVATTGYIYKLNIDSDSLVIQSINSSNDNQEFINVRNPLQLADYTYFQYENNVYICSPILQPSLTIQSTFNGVVKELSSLGDTLIYLETANFNTVTAVNVNGLSLAGEGESNSNAVSYIFNSATDTLRITNNQTGSVILYDPVSIVGNRIYGSLTPYLTYTILDYASIPGIFSITSVEHNSVIYNKTLDKTQLTKNKLFYNKYTNKAFLVYVYYPGIFS